MLALWGELVAPKIQLGGLYIMEATVKDGVMTLKFPVADAKSAPLSKSGKSRILFSSGGFATVDGYQISLNVIPAK